MFKTKDNSVNIWMSFSDLLTGALVVFMLITVVLVIRTRAKITEIQEKENEVSGNFATNLSGIEGVTVTDEGTIRFYTQSEGQKEQLFDYDSYELTPGFQKILNQSVPLFFKELEKVFQDESRSSVGINEIRIEGHTDSTGEDDYNLLLSQQRATQTWFYIRDSILNQKSAEFQEFVKLRIVTVGFGENKLLDEDGELKSQSGNAENKRLSRRVELSVLFRGFGNNNSQ